MDLLINDLSIAGQFPDIPTFAEAIKRVMLMRQLARQFGRELYCHKNMANAQVTSSLTMPQVIQRFSRAEQQAIMGWFTRHGPFWDDLRVHSGDDWLEFNGEIVTESSLAEAAYCCLHGLIRHLVTLTPSAWEFSPISVEWVNVEERQSVEVVNHWRIDTLEHALRASSARVMSWPQLEAICRTRFTHLTLTADCFEPLRGCPFATGAADRILVLMDTLEKLRVCVDAHGQRTPEGNRIIANHFSGGKAWFTDSSETEKNEFKKELTFPHPLEAGQELFCTWHGKVKTPQYRIHFSDPFRTSHPLYVVYIGPKITKT